MSSQYDEKWSALDSVFHHLESLVYV